MKKKLICALVISMATMTISTGVFASEITTISAPVEPISTGIETTTTSSSAIDIDDTTSPSAVKVTKTVSIDDLDNKVIPIKVNGVDYVGSYPAYLVDGTTYVSKPDLDSITGNTNFISTEVIAVDYGNNELNAFFPLRAEVEASNGVVNWDADNFSVEILNSYEAPLSADGVTISSTMFKTDGAVPVSIDGENTYLTINSIAPVVTVADDATFSAEVNELLSATQNYAISVFENADKTVTKEAFNNNTTIETNYSILSDEDGKTVIELTSKVIKNGSETVDAGAVKTTVNIDFSNKTVKSVR